MIRRPPRSTPFPTRRSSDLLDVGGHELRVGQRDHAVVVRRAGDRLGVAGVAGPGLGVVGGRSEEHTSELQSHSDLVCRLLLEKKKKKSIQIYWLRNTTIAE